MTQPAPPCSPSCHPSPSPAIWIPFTLRPSSCSTPATTLVSRLKLQALKVTKSSSYVCYSKPLLLKRIPLMCSAQTPLL